MSDDRLSAVIDLSRRKAEGLKGSIAQAGRAASPYLTMTRITLDRLGRDRMARAGGLLVALLMLVAVFADVLASDLPVFCRWGGVVYWMPNVTRPRALAGLDCQAMRAAARPGDWIVEPLVAEGADRPRRDQALQAPLAAGHPMGTDALGRDVFARVVHGTRTALGLGFGAAAILVAIGTGLGALAGFSGGVIDGLVSRAVESLTAIPTVVLVLVVGAVVPHPTTTTLLATIALTRWTELARLVRAEILAALRTDYVTAARALGASAPRVLWRHVLPNAIAPAVVGAAFAVSWVVLIEATVGFLRVSFHESGPSWGEVLGEARTNAHAWWLVAFPGAALLATLIAMNLVGEAARDALDPRLRGER